MSDVTYDNTYVAFLDILGFKDLVERNDHAVLNEIFNDNIDEVLLEIQTDSKNLIDGDYNIQYLSVSDSIIFWSDGDDPHDFLTLCFVVRGILTIFLSLGIPLRGGIARGPLTVKNNKQNMNIFGKGLTKAYMIENGQQWSGAVIDPEIINHLNVTYDFTVEKLDSILIYYKVPFSHGKILEFWVINWSYEFAYAPDDVHPEELIKSSFSKYNKNVDDWSVQNKIDNTLKFYQDSMVTSFLIKSRKLLDGEIYQIEQSEIS